MFFHWSDEQANPETALFINACHYGEIAFSMNNSLVEYGTVKYDIIMTPENR
jgi:hypothetical protein